jgi:arginine utilization protein RocB
MDTNYTINTPLGFKTAFNTLGDVKTHKDLYNIFDKMTTKSLEDLVNAFSMMKMYTDLTKLDQCILDIATRVAACRIDFSGDIPCPE